MQLLMIKNIDNPHKDLRRARSCNESIIPTSTEQKSIERSFTRTRR